MTHSFLNFDIQTNRDLLVLAKVLSDCIIPGRVQLVQV